MKCLPLPITVGTVCSHSSWYWTRAVMMMNGVCKKPKTHGGSDPHQSFPSYMNIITFNISVSLLLHFKPVFLIFQEEHALWCPSFRRSVHEPIPRQQITDQTLSWEANGLCHANWFDFCAGVERLEPAVGRWAVISQCCCCSREIQRWLSTDLITACGRHVVLSSCDTNHQWALTTVTCWSWTIIIGDADADVDSSSVAASSSSSSIFIVHKCRASRCVEH